MGSDITGGKDQRGFLIPWPFSTDKLWAAQSSYTEQGPKSGSPQSNGSYGLGITTTGDQSEDMTILTQKGGMAGRAEFVWKKSGNYFGKTPNTINSWEKIAAPVSGGTAYFYPLDCYTDSRGKTHIIVHFHDGAVPGTWGYRIYTRSTSGVWTHKNLYTQSTTSANLEFHGAICELEDNSLISVHWKLNTLETQAQIWTWRSTDGGANWVKISTDSLNDYVDINGTFGAGNSGYELGRLRIRSVQGQILMIAHLIAHNTSLSSTDCVSQWLSIDGGTSFNHVATSDGTFATYSPDLVVIGDQFAIGYINGVDTATLVVLPNPYTGVGTAKAFGSLYVFTISGTATIAGGLTNKHFTTGQFAMWEAPNGDLSAIFEEIGGSSNHRIFMMLSQDSGKTWKYTGGNTNEDNAQIFWVNTTGWGPLRLCGCSHSGGAIIPHNWDAPTATFEKMLSAFYVGGWTQITFPAINDFPTLTDYGWWKNTWVAIDTPEQSTPITLSGGGSTTLYPGYIQTNTTSGNARYYNLTYSAGTSVEGVITRVRLQSVSGGDVGRQERAIQLSTTISSGGATVEYRVVVQISTSQIRIHDLHAGADLATASIDSTNGIEVMVGLTGVVSCWYRITDTKPKTWTQLIAGQSLTSDPSGSSNYVRIGGIASPLSGAVVTNWMEWHVSNGAATGNQLSYGQTNPDQLAAHAYPPRGKYVYLDDGLSISSFDGPGREGDTYTIPLAHEYPIDRIFHANSPSTAATWKSVAVTSGAVPENTIALLWDQTISGTDDTMAGDLLGIHLENINFQDFQIRRYDIASGWQTIATVTNKIGPFNFTRDGVSLRSTGASGPYLPLHETAGWRIKLDDGSGNVVYRKIRSNSEGVLSAATTKKTQIYLDTVAQTDPASGSATIIPSSCLVVFDLQGAKGAALQIKITSQPTPENYFQIGMIVAGRVVIPGKQYSRGRSIRYESGTETMNQADGVQRSRVLDPGGRRIKLAWTDGVDVSSLNEGAADPNYIKLTTGGQPIGTQNDVPDMMMGLIRALKGAADPLVYIPRIFPQGSTLWTFNRYNDHMLCNLDSDIQIDNVLGDELVGGNIGEVFRVASIDLREIR